MESSDTIRFAKHDFVRRDGRRFHVGAVRIGTPAPGLVDVMEERHIIGPPEVNSQVRKVLDYGPTAPPLEE
jgi:S-DNA-T family DNA segregation ATPase FtsK/SpoIIIE